MGWKYENKDAEDNDKQIDKKDTNKKRKRKEIDESKQDNAKQEKQAIVLMSSAATVTETNDNKQAEESTEEQPSKQTARYQPKTNATIFQPIGKEQSQYSHPAAKQGRTSENNKVCRSYVMFC
jgi:hypothetical protein